MGACPLRRSGLPMPSRWTFVSALPASTLCVSAALRHPGYACSHSPLEGTGSPALAGLDPSGPIQRSQAPSASEGITAGIAIRPRLLFKHVRPTTTWAPSSEENGPCTEHALGRFQAPLPQMKPADSEGSRTSRGPACSLTRPTGATRLNGTFAVHLAVRVRSNAFWTRYCTHPSPLSARHADLLLR